MKLGRFVLLSFVVLAFVSCDSGGGDDGTPSQDTVTQTDTGSPARDTVGGEEDSGGSTEDVGCVPNCSGRSCGDDGCGGTCGTCQDGQACTPAGTCVCEKQCDGRECGPDGCGGECGTCDLGQVCNEDDYTCVAGGDLSCAVYFVCVDACAGDETCEADCAEARADEVVTVTDDLGACFEASCSDCEDLTCLQECGLTNCGADYAACFSGDGACVSILACVRECANDHVYGEASYEACRLDCVALGSPAEQEKYLALEACVGQDCDRNQPPADYRECELDAMANQCIGQSAQCSDYQ